MNDFIQQIMKNLETNGFPNKNVSFPTEKMYELADNKSLSLNKVLEVLLEKYQIAASIGDDKIIFSKSLQETQTGQAPEDMMKKAQEMMSKMDPAELERMKSMFENMSEEERAELMKKGRDMGIV